MCKRCGSDGRRTAAPALTQREIDLAMGGFMGGDPILRPDRLAALVGAGQLRFVMVGDAARMRRRFGLEPRRQAVADWVPANGQSDAPDLWHQPSNPPAGDPDGRRRGPGRDAARTELYGLKQQTPVLPGAIG